VLADRLTQDGKSTVLVVEAGPLDRNPFIHIPAGFLELIQNPRITWLNVTDPIPTAGNRMLRLPQGKVVGGTGSVNGMLYVRTSPVEHETWLNMGCTGWSFDEVLPYYLRAENSDKDGLDSPLRVQEFLELHDLAKRFLAATSEVGLPSLTTLNGAEREGAGLFHQTRAGRFRGGPGQTYMRRARRRPNLKLITEALCKRILFDNRRATGVEFTWRGQLCTARARAEVIVANGALRSPQLLQVSGIGPPEVLKSIGVDIVVPRNSVGQNLRDHYSVRFTQRVGGVITLNERTRGLPLARELFRYAFLGNGLLTLGASSAAAFARSREGLAGPDLQLSFAPASFQPGTYKLEKEPGMTIAVWQSFPDSRGTVTARSGDAAVPAAIKPNYLSASTDEVALLQGMKLARLIFATAAFRSIALAETLPGPQVSGDDALVEYARETGVSGFHFTGTCRMGGDGDAVVDPTLKVRGVDGLRVIDASVLPTATSGNTNAPTIMVAEKGADMILRDRRLAA
jgi:choline dehydrogenase